MYHSITFGNKNTWDDWKIVPTSRPVFNPPAIKKKIINIPGANGVIDLSESPMGFPVYENRVGSFEFIVMNDYKEWYQAYSDIMEYLHGQHMRAVLEDDKQYFYEGRFTVNNWKSDKNWSIITIDYDVAPYKMSVEKTTDEWKWDPFNFNTSIILSRKFTNLQITTTTTKLHFDNALFNTAPICPTFIVTSDDGVQMRFINQNKNIDIVTQLQNGDTQNSDFVFIGDPIDIELRSISGTSTVSIDFRPGRL